MQPGLITPPWTRRAGKGGGLRGLEPAPPLASSVFAPTVSVTVLWESGSEFFLGEPGISMAENACKYLMLQVSPPRGMFQTKQFPEIAGVGQGEGLDGLCQTGEANVRERSGEEERSKQPAVSLEICTPRCPGAGSGQPADTVRAQLSAQGRGRHSNRSWMTTNASSKVQVSRQ